MTNESFSESDSLEINCAVLGRGPQARRKESPLAQLAAARAHRKPRIGFASISRRSLPGADRMMIAELRAAELAAWQASGGDLLRSSKPN
jgi:hypothetical protein